MLSTTEPVFALYDYQVKFMNYLDVTGFSPEAINAILNSLLAKGWIVKVDTHNRNHYIRWGA